MIKKKIVYVIPAFCTGGAEKFVLELSTNINHNLFDVYIISFYNQKEGMHTYDYLLSKDIKIYFLDKKIGLDIKLFSRLKQLIKKIKPDIIHAHLDSLLYLIPSFNKRQKKFFTIHSTPNMEARGLQKLVRKYCFKFKSVVPIAISNQIAEMTKKYYKLKSNNIATIFNGIYLSEKTKKINTQENGKFVIIN